jgi:quercetin dioxygenase-like cupin family protein
MPLSVQTWDLKTIDTPGGSRSPVVLHSQDEARAVLVGLQPGQALGEHQVKEHAYVLVADGTVEIATGNGSIEAGAGTLLRFEPDERHAVAAGNGGARILMLLAPWPGEGHYRER